MSSERNAPLLETVHVKKYFPIRKGLLSARGRARARGRRRLDPGRRGRDARPRRRVRLRQVDARPHDRAPARADRRRRALRGAVDREARPARAAAAAARDADHLPGSVREPEPAQARRLDHRRPDEDPQDGDAEGRARKRVQELLETVGLSPEHYNRFPHEFSGGQRQRIGVARALALRPKLIVADEPVSALDVSIQAQMINLLEELQNDFKLTYVFIAHDLGVVRHVSDRIAVMYLGKLVELSPAEELYTRPIMPYTEALLSAVPIPDPDLSEQRQRIVLEGDVPSPIAPPSGCRFHPRCRYATEICSQVEPPLADYGNGHLAACHHPLNVDEETLRRVQAAPRDARGGRRNGSAGGLERRVASGAGRSAVPRSG